MTLADTTLDDVSPRKMHFLSKEQTICAPLYIPHLSYWPFPCGARPFVCRFLPAISRFVLFRLRRANRGRRTPRPVVGGCVFRSTLRIPRRFENFFKVHVLFSSANYCRSRTRTAVGKQQSLTFALSSVHKKKLSPIHSVTFSRRHGDSVSAAVEYRPPEGQISPLQGL